MRSMNLILAGLLMCAAGAALVFATIPDVPMWAAWLLGPTLWYLGFLFACAGFIRHIFNVARKQLSPRTEPQRTAVRPQRRFADAPMGLQHEVPPMGGFLL